MAKISVGIESQRKDGKRSVFSFSVTRERGKDYRLVSSFYPKMSRRIKKGM